MTLHINTYGTPYKKQKKHKTNEHPKVYKHQIDSIAKTYDNFKNYAIPQSHRDVYKTNGGTPQLNQNYTVFGKVIKGIK